MVHKQIPLQSTSKHDQLRAQLAPEQLKPLREALEAKKTELMRACEHYAELDAERPLPDGDMVDVAEEVIEEREQTALAEHERALLTEVEHALERIDRGTYGIGERSGRPIPIGRLRALPWARDDVDEAAEH